MQRLAPSVDALVAASLSNRISCVSPCCLSVRPSAVLLEEISTRLSPDTKKILTQLVLHIVQWWQYLGTQLRLDVNRFAQSLHARVIGPTTAFRRDPHDVLGWVFDVAGLAVHAVLRVDLQTVAVVVVLHKLVHAGGAVAALWACVLGQIDRNGNRSVFEGEVRGLVFFVVGVADEHAAQSVKSQCAIGLGIVDFCKLRCRLQIHMVGLATVKRPGG